MISWDGFTIQFITCQTQNLSVFNRLILYKDRYLINILSSLSMLLCYYYHSRLHRMIVNIYIIRIELLSAAAAQSHSNSMNHLITGSTMLYMYNARTKFIEMQDQWQRIPPLWLIFCFLVMKKNIVSRRWKYERNKLS